MQLERRHSAFVVLFDEDGVRMRFSHLSNGRGTLTAELEVLTTLPGFGQILLGPKQLNLLAESSQSAIAKNLARRCPPVRDWDGLMTEACRGVLAAYRAGEPSIKLAEIPEPEYGSWLIPGLVLARMPVVWFGDGSAGKSLLALAAAETLQGGVRMLGLAPSRQVNVLWLDWEFDGYEHRRRARAMLGDESSIRYRRCWGPLYEQVEAIEREIEEHNIGLLVCDSAMLACGSKPEDTEQTGHYFEALRRLDVGSITIAHETKLARLENHDKPFGSAFWHNNARVTWFIQKQQGHQSAGDRIVKLQVGMFNKKTNKGKLWRPFGFDIEIENDNEDEMVACRFKGVDLTTVEGLNEHIPLRLRISHGLTRGPATAEQLSSELGVKADTIGRTLRRMRNDKEVVVVDSAGKSPIYGLAARDSVDLSDFTF